MLILLKMPKLWDAHAQVMIQQSKGPKKELKFTNVKTAKVPQY